MLRRVTSATTIATLIIVGEKNYYWVRHCFPKPPTTSSSLPPVVVVVVGCLLWTLACMRFASCVRHLLFSFQKNSESITQIYFKWAYSVLMISASSYDVNNQSTNPFVLGSVLLLLQVVASVCKFKFSFRFLLNSFNLLLNLQRICVFSVSFSLLRFFQHFC